MNLHEITGGAEVLIDDWSISMGAYKQDDEFSIIGYIMHPEHKYEKIYIGFCKTCSLDQELYGEGYFKILKGNYSKGVVSCGCSSHTKWTKAQYEVLCRRAAQEKGYKFLGFAGEWRAQKTRIKIECDKGHIWETGNITRFLNQRRGCKDCGVEKVRCVKMKPDEEMIESFMKSGSFVEGTKFYRSDRKDSKGFWSYWCVECPECGVTAESQGYDLQLGKKPCECTKSRQKVAYINLIYSGSIPVAAKFGVCNSIDLRLRGLNRNKNFEIVNLYLYEFPDKSSCFEAERCCKKELSCGFMPKFDMPDGWTETFPIKEIEKADKILSTLGIKFVYKHDYRSEEGLKHLIAAGLEIEKLNT